MPYNPKSFDIGQGLNLSQYNHCTAYPMPKDLESIPYPVVGYIGWITSRRLDADLLYQIAQECSDINYVLVGKEDDLFKGHKLHTLKNVFFLGEKQQTQVPAYIAHLTYV